MAENVFKVHGYEHRKFTIPKDSVYTIEFNGVQPNYWRVNNMGETNLYFSTGLLPKTDMYDFKVQGGDVSCFAEPFKRDRIYCLNPENIDVDIIITYWSGEFDPTFTALSNITFNNEGTLKTDGVINAFNVPLPKGNNVIGKVDLNTTDRDNLESVGNNIDILLHYLFGSEGGNIGYMESIGSNIDDIAGQFSSEYGMNISDFLSAIWSVLEPFGAILFRDEGGYGMGLDNNYFKSYNDCLNMMTDALISMNEKLDTIIANQNK